MEANQTTTYLGRPTDSRITAIIRTHIPQGKSILDLGCGSGLYGQYLQEQCATVIGYDYDATLCETARATGAYSTIIQANILTTSSPLPRVDNIFCSEFLEHIPNKHLSSVIQAMENACADTIVITVPNPLSPHFSSDPTHITKYSIYSMYKLLQSSALFTYSMHAIGFSEYNKKHFLFRALDIIGKNFTICSPTILYVGKRKVTDSASNDAYA